MRGKECRIRSQAAMEYLMTYGWSILIIAVVLGALAYLGVFNPNTFAPRAAPGSCKVFKVGGNINLEGVCNGEMPQYVADFNIGGSPYISISDSASLKPAKLSVFAWVQYPSPLPNTLLGVASKGADEHHGFQLGWDFRTGSNFWAEIGDGVGSDYDNCALAPSSLPTAGSIHQLGMTYDGNVMTIYYDGKLASQCAFNMPIVWSTDSAYIDSIIGTYSYLGKWPFIANVQIYNASLDSNTVLVLYKEGIGGTPVTPANIVGWWPLNGDSNDYSGNNNNGVPTSVSYTNQWISGYTAPSH